MRPTPLLLTAVAFALTAGCTCGQKAKPGKPAPDYSALLKGLPRAQVSRPEAVLPSMPLVAVTSDAKGSWDALMGSDLGKALVKGRAVDDVKLSAQIEDVLSMAHEVAVSSEHPLAGDALASALAGPAARGLEPDKGEGLFSGFVFVKEVDPSQEMVVRLAVMFSSLKEARSALDYKGQKIAQLHHRGGMIYLSAFQNLVIASDRIELAKAAVDLARGEKGEPAQAIPEIKEEAATLAGPQALLRFTLPEDGPTAMITGLTHVLARLELSPAAVVKVRGTLSSAASQVAAHRAQRYVPNDAVLYASLGASNPEKILDRLAAISRSTKEQVQESFALTPEVQAVLGDEAFWALVGVRDEVFEHLIGLSLKDSAKAKQEVPAFLQKWGHGETRELSLGAEATGWCVEGKQLCAAVVKDFLLASTSEQQLEHAVRTARGESPALSDLKGLPGAIKPGEQYFLTTLLSTPKAADAALTFWSAVGSHNRQGVDPMDVDETVKPLCEALRTLPAFGGALEAKGTSVTGVLRAIQ